MFMRDLVSDEEAPSLDFRSEKCVRNFCRSKPSDARDSLEGSAEELGMLPSSEMVSTEAVRASERAESDEWVELGD